MGADKNPNFFLKFAAGSTAGALGSLAGNPFDVLKTQVSKSKLFLAQGWGHLLVI